MAQLAIKAVGLGKVYRLGARPAQYKTLRETLTGHAHRAVMQIQRALHLRNGHFTDRSGANTIWALKDVSFEINRSEVVGIIGRNGAGKSTLLKILSRITNPSAGYADIDGRIGSLLEVGTGFHPELTGRENIYLNGAILGMRKTEIKRKFDDIVEFSDVEKFIDTPVKHYSSGMHLRLAFAVAAHLEPEILFVDEVLAVGDAAFQKKCLGKMNEVAQEGRTVLLVSHNMVAIQELCQRTIWIDRGTIAADGEAGPVTQAYLGTLAKQSFHYVNTNDDLTVKKVSLRNSEGEQTDQFHPGDDLSVQIFFKANTPIVKPHLIVVVQGLYGPCFTANMLLDGHRPRVLEGSGSFVCKFKSIPLLPQNYTIKLGIRSNRNEKIGELQEIASFNVIANLRSYGFQGEFPGVASRSTPVVVPYEWILPDGSTAAVALKPPDHESSLSRTLKVVNDDLRPTV
jgi:lipopolysaccharide transport system ATP-binding protein